MELATPEQTRVGEKTLNEANFSRNRVEQRLCRPYVNFGIGLFYLVHANKI